MKLISNYEKVQNELERRGLWDIAMECLRPSVTIQKYPDVFCVQTEPRSAAWAVCDNMNDFEHAVQNLATERLGAGESDANLVAAPQPEADDLEHGDDPDEDDDEESEEKEYRFRLEVVSSGSTPEDAWEFILGNWAQVVRDLFGGPMPVWSEESETE